MTTRYLIVTRGGDILADERDSFRQLDGSHVKAPELDWRHVVPGRGRVLDVQPLGPAVRTA